MYRELTVSKPTGIIYYHLFVYFSNLYYKNGVRLPNGRIPTIGQVAANPSLIKNTDADNLKTSVDEALDEFFTDEWKELMAKDLYAAHTVCTTFYFSKKKKLRKLSVEVLFCRYFNHIYIYIYITIEST